MTLTNAQNIFAQNNYPKVINAVETGIINASKIYDHMTGGALLVKAPEYFITSHIALELAKIDDMGTDLEQDVWHTRNNAKALTRGRYAKKERIGGKFDLVVYDEEGDPCGIVEVKHKNINRDVVASPDIDRIVACLKNEDSSLHFGVLAYYIWEEAGRKKTANERLETMVTKFKTKMEERLQDEANLSLTMKIGTISTWQDEDEPDSEPYAWTSLSFIIAKNEVSSVFQ